MRMPLLVNRSTRVNGVSGSTSKPVVKAQSQRLSRSDTQTESSTSTPDAETSQLSSSSSLDSMVNISIGSPEPVERFQPETNVDDDTVGYFSKEDFLRANWEGAAEYIPPIGLAMVAGGLCTLNPAVFVGGALTAVGAVHAMGKVYEACLDGSLCQRPSFFRHPKQDTHEEPDALERSIRPGLSEVTFSMASMDEDEEFEVALPEKPVPNQTPPRVEASTPKSVNLRHCDPTALATPEAAMEWVNLFYPSLKHAALDGVKFVGLNAQEFFQVFFADDAPYSFSKFQEKRGDKDIVYGHWEALQGVTQPSLVGKSHMLSPGSISPPASPGRGGVRLQERVLNFSAKTKNGFLGPQYTRTTKVQRGLVASKCLFVLESKTTLKDVPFCDRFFIVERWVVTAERVPTVTAASWGSSPYVATLTFSCQAVFTKSCPFESQIDTKSHQTIAGVAQQWHSMAREALKRTERIRSMRLSESNASTNSTPEPSPTKYTAQTKRTDENDGGKENGIEIQRNGTSASFVIGA